MAREPGRARRIEFVYSPVHGSWLNMAEVEISHWCASAFGQRSLPDERTLRSGVETWQEKRNRLGQAWSRASRPRIHAPNSRVSIRQ
jgi:hypothetical protein